MITQLCLLLWKDFTIELRRGDVITTLISLSLLLGSLMAFGIQAGPLTPNERVALFPYLLWIPTILVGTFTTDKLLAKDFEEDSLAALSLAGIPLEICFFSKAVVTTLITLSGHFLSVGAMVILMNLPVTYHLLPFFLLSLLTVWAFSSLSVLVSAMTLRAQRISLLQPLVLIPLLFPLFFAASDAAAAMLGGSERVWLRPSSCLVGALAVLYGTLGVTLFEVAARE